MYYGWMKSCTSWSEIDGTLKPWHAQGVSHVPAVAGVFSIHSIAVRTVGPTSYKMLYWLVVGPPL